MSEIKSEHINLLFRSLNQILENQDKLNKHLGINRCDYEFGWEDNATSELASQCWNAACEYESEDDC